MDRRQLGGDHECVAGDLRALGRYLLYGGEIAAAEDPARTRTEARLNAPERGASD